uniref:Transposase n=1 Tax=Ascaris lumbricoides TaxID=6252 RepID=A0A0M3I055_ASCLU
MGYDESEFQKTVSSRSFPVAFPFDGYQANGLQIGSTLEGKVGSSWHKTVHVLKTVLFNAADEDILHDTEYIRSSADLRVTASKRRSI